MISMVIHGSRISKINPSSGSSAGEFTILVVPSFSNTSYATVGAVKTIFRSYSRLEPLLDDLHVEKAQEAGAEAKTQGLRCLGYKSKGGIIELQLVQGFTQILVIFGICRVDACKDHWLGHPVTWQVFGRGAWPMLVIGSPTRASWTVFNPVAIYPTSPALSPATGFILGEKIPTSMGFTFTPVAIIWIFSSAVTFPSTTRT